MKRLLLIILILLLGCVAEAQNDFIAISGFVTSGSKGVPYATLQLKGSGVGVSCNDEGEYELRVVPGSEGDTVVVRSVGYTTVETTVKELMRSSRIKLKEKAIMLKMVEVKDFRYPVDLLKEAIARIEKNYHKDTNYSRFFFRDWRAVDNELYLMDEAVIKARREGYLYYSDKLSYKFSRSRRELPTDFKTLLKHRLVVYDPDLVVSKVGHNDMVGEMLAYGDNESLFDPIYTPEASKLFAERVIDDLMFSAVNEFEDNGEKFYLLRAKMQYGKALMKFEYTIRKSDLAMVKLVSVKEPHTVRLSNTGWVNFAYSRMTYDADSSLWDYDVREGRYTLTRYYNYKQFHLGKANPEMDSVSQWWQTCEEWVLTDFSLADDGIAGDTIQVRPQTLLGAFGASDYDASYWGKFNSIVVDKLPLQMLREKLQILIDKKKE